MSESVAAQFKLNGLLFFLERFEYKAELLLNPNTQASHLTVWYTQEIKS